MSLPLIGLVAATHTPFHSDGSLQLAAIEKQAGHLLKTGVSTVFVGGSTGESHSLTVLERQSLAKRWSEVIQGTTLQLVIHVGSNCLSDSQALAAQAQSLKATAISALSPSYFKPKSLDTLIACCQAIASSAPQTPFYFYDIPVLTGVSFSMPEFLEKAPKLVPSLAGIKFTNSDLMAYQKCLQFQGGLFDIPWGVDEYLLAALALGAKGAVGSSYNFAAPIYLNVIAAFEKGDLEAARQYQLQSVQLIELLARYGYMAAAKATMGFLGVDVGPARLPNSNLPADQLAALRSELTTLGFFDWVKAS